MSYEKFPPLQAPETYNLTRSWQRCASTRETTEGYASCARRSSDEAGGPKGPPVLRDKTFKEGQWRDHVIESASDGLSRRLVLGALAALPTLPALFGAASPGADGGRPIAACVLERRAGEAGDPRFHPRDHRPVERRRSCRRRSASRPSTRTARCGSSIRSTRRWSIALTACRPWSRRSPSWPSRAVQDGAHRRLRERSRSSRCTTWKRSWPRR